VAKPLPHLGNVALVVERDRRCRRQLRVGPDFEAKLSRTEGRLQQRQRRAPISVGDLDKRSLGEGQLRGTFCRPRTPVPLTGSRREQPLAGVVDPSRRDANTRA
jgi:hypothetical protein